ncbi:hypothetical protein [Sphingomonas quercus]|nr:hypothetical protein [Sphingomonas quercus]
MSGAAFVGHRPVADDGLFDDLLAKLDRLEVEPQKCGGRSA